MLMSSIIRKQFKEGDDIRDEGLVTPPEVLRYDNLLYGEDERWQCLDVYRPREGTKVLPVIVSVHGGGWVYGDKERYQFYCMDLAKRGFAVVNFTYRLAPEYQFPAPIEDTGRVFEWVSRHADEYGFDLESVFATGDSAGANILALYTEVCTNDDYARILERDYVTRIARPLIPKAIALNCGAYRIAFDETCDTVTKELMKEYLPEAGSEEELNKINVLSHVTSGFPPTFLMTAEGDFLKDQAGCLMESFLQENVPFEFHYYTQSGNANMPEKELGHVFHLNIRHPQAAICNDEECLFFEKHIRMRK